MQQHHNIQGQWLLKKNYYVVPYSRALFLLLEEEPHGFYALFDGTGLRYFVEGLVLLEDVVFAFIIDVDVCALDISKTCCELVWPLPRSSK